MAPDGTSESGGGGIITARVDACEMPSYHQSSRIQAHGLLLAVDPLSFRILYISANAGSILGIPNDILLDTSILALLTPVAAAELRGHLTRLGSGDETRMRVSLGLEIMGQRCFSAAAFLYRSDSWVCVEIEPPGRGTVADSAGVSSSRFFDMADGVARSDGPSDQLAGVVCDAIRRVTGFDRTYFCQFDQVGHGHVLGESNNGVLSPLMDHHFPATDIPHTARRIMVANPFRLIPDVDAPDVPIIGRGGGPLDLTFSTCRAIAGTHLQYLRNMNVGASLSFSVVSDGRLEALFGGHHHAARPVSFHQMAVCWHLVELFKARFDSLKMREDRAVMAQNTSRLHDLAMRFLSADCDLSTFISINHTIFCDLMDADDVACRFGGQDHPGRLLPAPQASELLDFLAAKVTPDSAVFQSDSLIVAAEHLQPLCPAVAGALAVTLDLSGSNIIAWLRSEAIVRQTWSGDPHHAVQMDDTGAAGPRKSFLSYIRETRGISRPWPSTSSDLAHQLRFIFSQVLARHYETGMRKAAEQASALKSDFISNVSHELRSPLHAIVGFSEVLSDDDGRMSQADRIQSLNTIIHSGQRLLHLVDDLLDLSRLHAGKMTFTFRVGAILPVIERAVGAVDALARKRGIAISIHDAGHHDSVLFDADRMEQVIVNLLSNALKVSQPQSAIGVEVRDTSPDRGPQAVMIEVSDQGVGIPSAELELIFDKFIQSSRTKNGAGGTGLGLAICREIISAHRGRIWAANRPAGGASFFVELPWAASQSEQMS